ncbi:MAG: hypothetical protein GY832_21920 [Chloroflexi bacterium]|nr:hypothetical protein [Chloroflexota bacterium]
MDLFLGIILLGQFISIELYSTTIPAEKTARATVCLLWSNIVLVAGAVCIYMYCAGLGG